MWSRRNPSQSQKNLRKRRLQNGDHWYKSAGENKKIEVRTEICWVLCYIKVSLSKSFLLCMYFYKGFFKKTQITGSIEKISSMGEMRQTRYLRLITQMSLKKRSQFSRMIIGWTQTFQIIFMTDSKSWIQVWKTDPGRPWDVLVPCSSSIFQ